MKTSVIKVGDMLSVWSLDEVESRIGEVPDVESVTVNFAAESATVRYDETRVAVADIKSTVRELGLQRAKQAKDVPVAEDLHTDKHKGHLDKGEPDAAVVSTGPKSKTDIPAATLGAHAGNDRHDDRVSDASTPSTDKQTDRPKQPSGHAGHENHDKHQGHSPAMFRDRFWLSLAVTVPVVIWSAHIEDLLGYQAPAFPGSDWMPAVLSTAVFLYGGLVFLQGAWRELKDRLPGMMTLISLAITVAFVFSWVVQLGFIDASALWWELATLVTIMLLGHWIEMRSINQAEGALKELAKLLPDTATRITDAGEEEVAISALQNGDLLLVRPGESVPADGVVRKGTSDIDEAMITGESRPVRKGEGDEVIAATINGEGSLRIEVTGTGDKTKLSGIMRLVADAQTSKSRAQHLADRAARLLTVAAIVAAVLTFAAWQLAGAEIDFSVVRMVTVLVIACPHALGLAVPLVVAISTTLGAQNGLLVRDRRGLEEARNLDTVIFDKTGTLTLGEFRVVAMSVADGLSENEALRIASGIEAESQHPIARGIVKTAEDKGIAVPSADGFRSITGKGVAATIDGAEYHMGGPALLKAENVQVPPALLEAAGAAADRGQAAIYLVREGKALAVYAVADAIREESREAIAALHDRGIEVAMLTGDAQAVADAVAKELGIDTVFAEVLPEEKASKVRELQAQGKKVAMIGDGVNDAPALATADIGIAIGAGADVAVEAGHIVLVRSDPRDIPRIITLSQATYRKMMQNLWWAAGYNIFAIPLAAGVLAPWGIVLTPAIGAVLMSASTIVVAINAQLLKRVRL
ncbi:heavy metal translocating P-type ATPase [Oceaniovalibus sp. ACAM 378]|uniref:heavy metal translocating P-type ATPase n=1 Tax=Oceaniovalibus sp. ACAM 378 TaxID=2599923 RepID=UPI0011D8B459|nr:heavy metal translocating P-type ATPase [Oceaniovalibus sp. ACAM 378]TYB90039.1 heavy metal translocating P-type ATPase [Oceaniovalibus sp. ACAM 378]